LAHVCDRLVYGRERLGVYSGVFVTDGTKEAEYGAPGLRTHGFGACDDEAGQL